MKKLSALLLAIVMIAAMMVPAFAEEPTYPDVNAGKTEDFVNETSVVIPLYYKELNEGSVSPAETFKLKIEAFSVAQTKLALDAVPAISDASVTFAKGDATVEGKRGTATITLPEPSAFGTVGLFTYKITQIVPESGKKTAGVYYDTTPTFLKLTVIEQNGLKVIAAVHYETENGTKIDGNDDDLTAGVGITNIYKAAAKNPDNNSSTGFAVKKIVTGNFGDKAKEFTVNVRFTAPEGSSFCEDITYTEGGEPKKAAFSSSNTVATAQIKLKHNETISFSNVPYSSIFVVSEADYTGEADGYDAPKYSVDNGTGTISAADLEVSITNNKGVQIDTGVIIDSIPYIVILAFIIGGAALLIFRRKPEIG